ncbi:hypothetical protein FPOAC2_04480 [Fusarium poae]
MPSYIPVRHILLWFALETRYLKGQSYREKTDVHSDAQDILLEPFIAASDVYKTRDSSQMFEVQPYHASKSDGHVSIGYVIRGLQQRSNVISPWMSLQLHTWLDSNKGSAAPTSRRMALGLETFSTWARTAVVEATARNAVWSQCRLIPSVL